MDLVCMAGLVLVVLVAIIFVSYFVIIYNGLVTLRNNIRKSWANIDVLLKQRSDELPKLVEVVKGYMKHERETLYHLTEARTFFLSARTIPQKASADGMISDALKTLFAVAENYPDLKASQNFLQLQHRISGLENEIADRREFYNDCVNNHNIRIQSIPDMFVARMMGLGEEAMFEATAGDRLGVEMAF